jgi:hypothetical protein
VGAISRDVTRAHGRGPGTREKRYQLRGVRAEYQRIRNMQLIDGRWINEDDTQQRNRVAVLGATVARELSAASSVNEESLSAECVLPSSECWTPNANSELLAAG